MDHACAPFRHARTCSTAVRFNFYGLGARFAHERVSAGARDPGHGARRAGIARRRPRCRPAFPIVMPGLVPGIHVLRRRGASRERARRRSDVDARNKSRHDDMRAVAGVHTPPGPVPDRAVLLSRHPGLVPGSRLASNHGRRKAGQGRCRWLWTPAQGRGDSGEDGNGLAQEGGARPENVNRTAMDSFRASPLAGCVEAVGRVDARNRSGHDDRRSIFPIRTSKTPY